MYAASCRTIRVTRHEPFERPWLEWYRAAEKEGDLPERIECDGTPECRGQS
jgi:hypothetical protein